MIRCYLCGRMASPDRIVRMEVQVGSSESHGRTYGSQEPQNYYGSSNHYGVRDVCFPCANEIERRQEEAAKEWAHVMKWMAIIVGPAIGIVVVVGVVALLKSL